MQGKFLLSQYFTEDSILPILSKTKQDYTAASTGINAEEKDEKYDVTPVIFKSDYKVVLLLPYQEVVLAWIKSVVDNSKLDYLLRSRCSYTPAQRSALADDSFKDSVSDIAMTGSAFMENNARVYDALTPGIFGTLAEQVLTATIKKKKYF